MSMNDLKYSCDDDDEEMGQLPGLESSLHF